MHSRHAFTLVELSIVLVILGLLVGGVLSGQSLIHASQLRGISSEYTRYITATHAFKDKYFALPGDMPNATSFWGELDADPSVCAGTESSDTATCNGDGDAHITGLVGREWWRYWQHLANAGLVEGTYTGASADNGGHELGKNAPPSKIANATWVVIYAEQTYNNATTHPLNNTFLYGGISDEAIPYNPVLTPQDAFNVDSKMDDGNAMTGRIRPGSSGDCLLADDGPYNLAGESIECMLYFLNAM